MGMRALLFGLVVALALAGPGGARGAHAAADPAKKGDFPDKGKPITLIVSYQAGSASDVGGRLLAAAMQKELGTTVQVMNKPGASTQVGTTALIMAKPDGYTIASMTLATSLITYLDPARKAPYNRKSFAPIAMHMVEPVTIAVRADSPYKTLKDLVNDAKARPGQIKAGTGGLMSNVHLAGLLFQKAAGIDFAYVHFDGGGPGVTRLMGGHLDIGFFGSGNLTTLAKAGQVRVLGLIDTDEAPFLPGVKTVKSLGYNVTYFASYGTAAPAGTPKDAIDAMSAAIAKGVQSSEFQTKMLDVGLAPRYMEAAKFADFWDQVEAQTKPLIEELLKEQK